jgi:hypothetical protein
MKNHGISSWCLLAALALGPLAACSMGSPPSLAGDPMGRLLELVGDAPCNADAQCQTLAVGANACGGPQAFLAWSTLQTRREELEAAVASQGNSRLAQGRHGGMISTCAVVVDPGARCRQAASSVASAGTGAGRHCQLNAPGEHPGLPTK